jgi:hypothetical protein
VNNWNHAAIGTREQLEAYDPEGYELVKSTFRLTPENDWRFRPLRTQPSVIAPPIRLQVDPYYTKFTMAREFPVLGSARVSDEALLKTNHTIRKMFAYRHDILKALIADGVRVVVLGRDERLADLPEFRPVGAPADQSPRRYVDYTPALKLIVVPEEDLMDEPAGPAMKRSLVISAFAKALYQVTALRPVDPAFEQRRDKQQYELRVKRMDVEFDRKLTGLFNDAIQRGLWKKTRAADNRVEYLSAGVEAYFDASGRDLAPESSERPIATREALQSYDPELISLVEELMAYVGHADWRWEQ